MSKTPRTDELRNRASKGNLDESDLFDAAEQLETELASVQLELGATKGELSEAKSQVNDLNNLLRHVGWGQGEIDSASSLVMELEESQAREAQLREALGIAINGLQEWCDDVDRDSSWDGWDSNFKHWKWKGIKELEQALTTK